jgi:hypothetical protein
MTSGNENQHILLPICIFNFASKLTQRLREEAVEVPFEYIPLERVQKLKNIFSLLGLGKVVH